jgi:hypothetical protein
MTWWNRRKEEQPEVRPDKPRRSRYADAPHSRDTKVVVADGRIIGHELGDGTFVKLKDCCENPCACEREECWAPWPDPGLRAGGWWR